MKITKNRLKEIIREELASVEEGRYEDDPDDGRGDHEMELRRDQDEMDDIPHHNPLIKDPISGRQQADNFFRAMEEEGWKGPGTPWPDSK
mgnify:FL=1